MWRGVGAFLVAAALVGPPGAGAKTFEPGDVRLCGVERCVPIVDRPALRALGAFMYHAPPAPVVRAPRLGAASFELRFDNGYVTGLVASRRLDRFLSYGVNIGHFDRGRWYRLPDRTARQLRWLAAAPPVPRALRPTSFFDLFIHAALRAFGPPLEPLRLTRAAARRSR
jgi:hypothetical protein